MERRPSNVCFMDRWGTPRQRRQIEAVRARCVCTENWVLINICDIARGFCSGFTDRQIRDARAVCARIHADPTASLDNDDVRRIWGKKGQQS